MNNFQYKKSAWLMCIIASFLPLYSFIQMNMFNVLGAYIQEENNLTLFQTGLLSASFLYAQSVFLIPAGLLLDRFSTKRLIIISMILLTGGTFIFAMSNNIYILFFARIVTGVAHAFAILSCFQMISLWFPANKNQFLMGLVMTIALLGGLLAQAPFLLLVNTVGEYHSMLINSAIGAFITLFLLIILKDPPGVNFNKNKEFSVSILLDLKTIFSNIQNWLCGFYACCMSFPMLILGAAWGVAYLMQAQEISAVDAAYITSMIFIGMMIGSPLAGIIADHSNYRKAVLIFSPFVMLLIFLIIIFAVPLSFFVLMVLFFFLGVLSGPQVLVYPIIINNNKPLGGLALGFSSTIIMLGGALAQTIVSYLASVLLKIRVEQAFDFAILVLPAALILCFIAALKIKEKPG